MKIKRLGLMRLKKRFRIYLKIIKIKALDYSLKTY